MTTYSYKKTTTEIQFVGPYNPHFAKEARGKCGGKWMGDHWSFDLRDEVLVKRLLDDAYSWREGMEQVSVEVVFNEDRLSPQGPFVLLGRVIAAATGRDSGARLGDGVRLLEGVVTSGGSRQNWTTVIRAGALLVIHDVPLEMAQDYVESRRESRGVEVIILPRAVTNAPADMPQLNAAIADENNTDGGADRVVQAATGRTEATDAVGEASELAKDVA